MLELQTFGGLEVRKQGGQPVDALDGRTKCLALLAYLAAEAPADRRVPREEIAVLLWPGGTDERARNSLRVALTHIRQATDCSVVAGEGASSLGLVREHLRADVTAFLEALEAGDEARALELYGGDFLSEIRVPGAGRFLRWADERRGRFRNQAYKAALSLGDSAREAGDLTEAEVRFRTALDLAPLREEAAGKLIRTLADRGRTSDAVQLFEAFRQRRRQELGLDASEELEERVEVLKRVPRAASAGAEDGERREAGSGREAAGTPTRTSVRPRPRDAEDPVGAEPSGGARFARRTVLGALVALGLLGAALAGAWHLVGSGGESAPRAGDRSVAVLPFEAIGEGDPGPVAAGLHNDLLTRLSNASGLTVVSGTSVDRYRDADLPLPAIAESLGVKWVVEGDVQQTGGRIQVNAQLIDPRTDTHAWATTYRRELTAENLFDIQSEITRDIARELEARLTPAEEERIGHPWTRNLEAYRHYVQGRSRIGRRTGEDARQAVLHFRRAIGEDSSFAPAWSGLADAVSLADVYGWRLPAGPLPDPRDAARRALELAPDLAEAHATLGRLVMNPWGERDAPAAYRELRRAVELRPSYAQAHHWLGYLELALGDLDRAMSHLTLATELDPALSPAWGTLAWAYLAKGQPGEALARTRREAGPEGSLPEDDATYAQVLRDEAHALYHQGRHAEVARIARRGLAELEAGRSQFQLLLVAAEAAAGDTVAARRQIARMQEEGAPPVPTGMALAAVGDVNAAFEHFLRDDTVWPPGVVVQLRYWYADIMRPIKEDPRYPRLVRQIERKWKMEPDGRFGGLGESG